MWRDPIVEEIRKIREAYAAQFDFDLERIGEDLREKQKEYAHKLVSFAPKPTKSAKRRRKVGKRK